MSVEEVFHMVEVLMADHKKNPVKSKLKRYCPHIGRIFVPVDLRRALRDYDAITQITKRVHVSPTFAEVRRIFNLASVHAIAPVVKLITLDADDTIYGDGLTLTVDSPIIPLLVRLMRLDCHISLVTAAGYPDEPHKYEARIAGFLQAMAFAIETGADPAILKRFHLMGGECNYLLEPVVHLSPDGLTPTISLQSVPDDEWKDGRGVRWDHHQVQELLDCAEACLKKTAELLNLDVLVIRKKRAVGIIQNPAATASVAGVYGSQGGKLTYEVLEECALAVQKAIKHTGIPIPHCAFNGGHDVFIDVGEYMLSYGAAQRVNGVSCHLPLHETSTSCCSIPLASNGTHSPQLYTNDHTWVHTHNTHQLCMSMSAALQVTRHWVSWPSRRGWELKTLRRCTREIGSHGRETT